MSKKKNKKSNNRNIDNEDYEDISGKGIRKEKRKAKRHQGKRILDDLMNGGIDTEDYEEFLDYD